MPRFFCNGIAGDRAVITGEDAAHIAKSLRMRPGEEIVLCDGNGNDYKGKLLSVDSVEAEVEIFSSAPSEGEPTVKVRLYQALPKGDKLETIVQKAVELGADEIVPVLTHRCVSRPDQKSMEKKRARLGRIALEAAKQSMRGRVPEVLPMRSFAEAIEEMGDAPLAILFYEEATHPLRELLGSCPARVSIFVGSEGGFEPSEVEAAREKGIAIASLGSRILRCETAPLAALSAIMYATDNL